MRKNVKQMTKMNILLIDDEKLISSSLSSYLEKNDSYAVYIASNGQDALSLLQVNHVDIILTDLNLPDFKDFELVESIRAQDADIPIIIMSAQFPDTIHYHIVKHNIFNCMTKPFDLDDIFYSVSDALHCSYGSNQGMEGITEPDLC
ncbi:MAG: response regulator [Nitrospiraceae bacterium]|nr:MAG: response regulator [Nitrospiraceae bacterium]